AEIAYEDEVVIDRRRGERAVHLFIAPNYAALRDVAGLRGIDAEESADPLAMLRVLSNRNVRLALVEHRSCDDFGWTVRRGVLARLAAGIRSLVRPVRVALPENGCQRQAAQ